MDFYKEFKEKELSPILREENFKKLRKDIWVRNKESKLTDVIQINKEQTISIEDFKIRVSYGIYFEGLFELCYGLPTKLIDVVNCIYRPYEVDNYTTIKDWWNIESVSDFEKSRDEIKSYLSNTILPFLNKVNDFDALISSLYKGFEFYCKYNTLLALKMGCVTFLNGNKNEGIKMIEEVNSRFENYEFGLDILERMQEAL